jgi:ABC-2 type transport system ATP-binding protein
MTIMTHPALRIQGARKRYHQTVALDGAALDLYQREWLALLGPNGAGKTTLIRAVAGRAALDDGSIELLGQRLNARAADGARARLGVVPQEIAVYPLLTARENLEIFGALHGVSGGELRERVGWALEFTALADRANHLAKTFSGGMKRRLNIACGVLHRPAVILLDEPTVGVDPQSRERIWQMLAELRDDGASLLLTTHQLDEAQQVSDRIAIIDHGRVIASGTMDELVDATIGRGRGVTLTLDAAPPALHSALNGDLAVDGTTVRGQVQEIARELPAMLERIAAAGGRVRDVHIEHPTLQAVFIHLTGRELRE